ncbi:MAG: condensation domain-containing protein, partial [Phormidesmis sp.]
MTIQDLYELSPMQQGMLFHSLYAPETSVYFEQRHCLLSGMLEPQAFQQAWQQVCDRYDVLRSEFHWEETDQPLQVVYQKVELPWTMGDWRGLSAIQQSEKLEAFLIADRLQGFQPDCGPLMRCALFQLADRQYRFVWSYHHLLMDGWCNGVLIKDVLAIYRAVCQGMSCLLPPVKPYRDYILWLQQQDKAAAERYWRDVLQGFDSPTSLGIDRESWAIADTETAENSEHQIFLSSAFSEELQTFAKQSRLTLNTLLQGAWAIALSRYSGLQDVLFGITVSGRPPELTGVGSMVGLFINTVPLRVELPESAEVLPWLQQLQQAQRDRETYSYSLLTDVQSWSDVPSGVPLFESLLIFENYPISIEAATQGLSQDSGLSLSDGQGYEQTNYPLVLVVIPGREIQLSLRYDAQRISKPAAARLLGHLEVILRSFVENPKQQLSQVPLLTQSEHHQLNEFSQGEVVEIPRVYVHQQFESRALETPEAIAVTFSVGSCSTKHNSARLNDQISYQQLNQRANQIAHCLTAQGVKKGTRVGLCLPRSVDLVACLIAILKAGGTYIPLDPSHPTDRLRYIISDAQIELLVTTTHSTEKLSNKVSTTFCLDEKSSLVSSQSVENLSPTASADDTAYLLYTSGSTGKPKGVPIRHFSLTNFLASMAQLSSIKASDTLLAVTTLGFDIAALEIFLPLVTGAHLVMTPHEATLDGHQLAAQLADYNVTLMQATPATWRLLLDTGWRGSAKLRMLCGGEALDFALAQQLLNGVLSFGGELWNLY